MEVSLIATLSALLAASWRLATPLIYASLGESISERAGVLNIGLEGVMLVGAFAAFAIACFTGSPALGLGGALLCGLLIGFIFAFLTVTIRANQIVVGAALNLFGLGLTSFLFRSLFVGQSSSHLSYQSFPPMRIPIIEEIPFLGKVLSGHNAMVDGSIGVVVLGYLLLYRTAFGLSIRASGEHPGAVDAAGVKMRSVRYAAILIGTSLAAAGGAYLTIAHANQFVEGITSGRGFIVLAVVVVGRWSPTGSLLVSLLFGLFYALQLRFQSVSDLPVPYQLLQALPYVMTILVCVLIPYRMSAPKALGVPH